MLTRTLGKSGIEVSAMGMGCWAIGGPWWWADDRPMGWSEVDDSESIRSIHTGMELGVNFFDTAANYGAGHSERVLGQAVAGRRDQVVIATKFGHVIDEETKIVTDDSDNIIRNIRTDCENSLRRLNTDYIDIYQLHEGSYDPEMAPSVINVLDELVKEGKIRSYGWSTDVPEGALIFAPAEHCASIQFRVNVFQDNPEMRALCHEFDIGGINKSPLNAGILTGKFSTDSTFPDDDFRSRAIKFSDGAGRRRIHQVEMLREVLSQGGRTPAQGSLAWIWALDERMVPIPGFKTADQVRDNAGALEFGPFTDEEMAEVSKVLDEIKEM
jgi:aryl-alcohol dehydrogenase-like predicted oxidoreductase